MGLLGNMWNGIKKGAKAFGEGVKTVGKAVVVTAYAITHPIETLEKIAEVVYDTVTLYKEIKEQTTPTIGTFNHSSSTSNDEEKKQKMKEEYDMICKYQSEVKKRADERTNSVKSTFLNIYINVISVLKETLGEELAQKIEKKVNNVSEEFPNTLCEEVNSKIGDGEWEWFNLKSNHPSQEQIQNYCDRVYKDADNHFLDLVLSKTEETNKFISQSVKDYFDSMSTALHEMQDSLVNLSKNEESKAQELMECAKELAVAKFIVHETSKEI